MIKKYLHTRFRVSDMGESLQFYRDILGMEVLKKNLTARFNAGLPAFSRYRLSTGVVFIS